MICFENSEEYRISDIKSLKATRQNYLNQALANSADIPGGKSAYASTGFSYVLKDGKEIESGILTTETEKIAEVLDVLKNFLDVPVV